eukprot:1193789-Prorocentrum_minimum.AAC.1
MPKVRSSYRVTGPPAGALETAEAQLLGQAGEASEEGAEEHYQPVWPAQHINLINTHQYKYNTHMLKLVY